MQQTFLEHIKYLYSVFSHDNIFISGLMLEIWILMPHTVSSLSWLWSESAVEHQTK